jgi:peptidoglycan biosynthesis protein MviN/MurJ (putative lipid II flippase)
MSDATGSATLGRRIVHGMIVIIFFGLFMRLGSFLMNWLVHHYYGAGSVLDAFSAVYNKIIFLLFFSTALKIINPVFMPLFVKRLQDEGEERAWEFATTVTNLCFAAAVATGGLAFVFAPELIATLLPKFSAETQGMSVTLLRWMLPGLLAQMLAVQALGVLNSYKVFSWPAAADAAQKLVWTVCFFAAAMVIGGVKVAANSALAPHLLGASYLVSCVVQAGVLLYGLRDRLRFYRWGFPSLSGRRLAEEALWVAGFMGGLFAAWLWLLGAVIPALRARGMAVDDADGNILALCGFLGAGCLYAASLWYRSRRSGSLMGRFAFLAAPLIVGVLFARFRDLGLAFFQTYTEEGQFGLIELANKVANFPSVLIAFSLSVAMFPYLCEVAARRDEEQHARIMSGSLRMIALALLPVTALAIVLGEPAMRLIFDDRGTWSPDKARAAGLALSILSTGLFFSAIENVLMQSFFSRERMMLPTALGIVFAVLPVAALYVLIERMGYRADPAAAFVMVCVAYPAGRALKNLFLLYFAHRRHPIMPAREAWSFLLRMGVICAAVAVAARVVYGPVARALPVEAAAGSVKRAKLALAAQVALPALAALAIFVALCLLLKMEETQLLIRWVREKGWKLKKPKPDTAMEG